MNAVKELGKRLAARLDEDDWGYIEPFLNECETEIESLRQQLADCQALEAKRITELRIISRRAKGLCNGSTPIQNAPYFIWQSAEAALSIPNDDTCLNELIAERTKTQKEYYESVFQDGANRIAELTAEVERLKGEQYVQLDIHTDDTRTKQQRELDGAMEVGQLLADSENSTASNSAFKGTEHLTWVHTGNGCIFDSSGRFIGAFSGDFRNRDRFICAVNSENQLRQKNAELTEQRDGLLDALQLIEPSLKFAGWENADGEEIGTTIDAAIANCK